MCQSKKKTKIYISTILEEINNNKDKLYFNTLSDIYEKLNLQNQLTFEEFKELLNNYLIKSNIDFYYADSLANDNEIYINFNNKKEANKFIKLLREKFEN